jgi:hypothetical protein
MLSRSLQRRTFNLAANCYLSKSTSEPSTPGRLVSWKCIFVGSIALADCWTIRPFLMIFPSVITRNVYSIAAISVVGFCAIAMKSASFPFFNVPAAAFALACNAVDNLAHSPFGDHQRSCHEDAFGVPRATVSVVSPHFPLAPAVPWRDQD